MKVIVLAVLSQLQSESYALNLGKLKNLYIVASKAQNQKRDLPEKRLLLCQSCENSRTTTKLLNYAVRQGLKRTTTWYTLAQKSGQFWEVGQERQAIIETP